MPYRSLGGLTLGVCLASAAQGQWVKFVNETSTRMPICEATCDATPCVPGALNSTPCLTTHDSQEKDYAWGDVDQDGDIDLVCVRKTPFTSTGRRPNVLFMNEGIAEGHSINGVLVDRTALYGSATDAPAWDDPQISGGSLPDQGLLTWTNDRDVVLVDVDNDTWLDIVTATTLSDPSPLHIGHPRIYMNQGEVKGVWQGFKYEMARIPDMRVSGIHPRFCSVNATDVTGDGYVDLYFGDYDSGGGETYDYNNKFLINQGAANPGYFTDTTTTRITSSKLLSAFGAATAVGDMNGDGAMDWIKQTSLNPPQHVAVHTNNPNNPGFFPDAGYKEIIPAEMPYFVSVGDLNNDGKLDMVITDDNPDHYHLNSGNTPGANGNPATANFSPSKYFLFQLGADDDGFGSQSVITDLNNDGWNDVVIADVDVDIPPCGGGRRMHIYRNLGDAPNVTLQEQATGPANACSSASSTCVVAGIPANQLTGTHNVAIFDINNDGWKDMVVGRCSGTSVWMNVPPAGLVFGYPQGIPAYIEPDQPHTFQVQVTAVGGGSPQPDTGKIFVSLEGGPYVESPMTHLGGNLYEATLPATACPEKINFYFSAHGTSGTFLDPEGAPANSYLAVAAAGTEITLIDEIEGDVSQWSVVSGGATSGAWEAADPNGTVNAGVLAAPEDDATGGAPNVTAFVTQNGVPGGAPGAADVDGGATFLLSPTIDLAGTDATISYSRWFYQETSGDSLRTEVSNDNGASWTTVHFTTGTSDGVGTAWQTASFVVSDFVTPTANVRVRFTATDAGTPTIVEAGIDDFIVNEIVCDDTPVCIGDIAPAGGDGTVNVQDLLAVIASWGPCGKGCNADIAPAGGDGTVNVQDLLAVIAAWGACP